MEQTIKPLMTLKETCRYTGMSVYSLRQGVKNGTIPHIVSGGKYLVNVPLFLERLNSESNAVMQGKKMSEEAKQKRNEVKRQIETEIQRKEAQDRIRLEEMMERGEMRPDMPFLKKKSAIRKEKEEQKKKEKREMIEREIAEIQATVKKTRRRGDFCIYKHTFPDGCVYIGQTNNTQKRWRDGHGYKGQPKIFYAIIKYGWVNITHEILVDGLSKEEADRAEELYIEKYNSVNEGYNTNAGYNRRTSHIKFVYGKGEVLMEG